MRNAAEYVLVKHAGRGIEQSRRSAALLEGARHLLVDVALHAIDDFGPECRLGDMGVDIDDEIVVGPFLGGVREDVAGVGLIVDLRQLADARRRFAILGNVLIAVFVVFLAPVLARHFLQHRFPPLAAGTFAPRYCGESSRNSARMTSARYRD